MAEWHQVLKVAGRRSFPWVAGLSLVGAAVVWTNRAPAEGQPTASAELTAANSANRTDPEVRLQFFSTPWPKVLNKLAEETGSTLVMQDVPPGRYSRNDWGKYTRREAVQILNRELEPLGFRILEKDQFLTVIQIRRMRLEYQRPVAPVSNAAADSPQPNSIEQAERPVPVGASTEAPTRLNPLSNFNHVGNASPLPSNQVTPATATEPGRFPNAMVRPAAHEQPAEMQVSSITISPQFRPALDIAKQLHRAFGERSALVNQGPSGLPAFTVTRTVSRGDESDSDRPATLFTIEIDTDQNSLIITASPDVQVGLRGLINSLDVNPLANQIQPRLMAGSGQTVEIAEQLKFPLAQVAQANAAQAGRQRNVPTESIELAQANQPPPGQAPQQPDQPQQQPVPPGTPAERVLQSSLGNLKGDVTIESMPDLDLLILRGNQEDVEKVMEVIRQVEQLAAGTMPEIRLHLLEYVDSQSLAALLNDLYTRLAELRARGAQQGTASVAFVPVAMPNALLILAPSNSMEFIIDLVLKLDQPVNPDHQLQVFRLKHAVAADVALQLEEFYQQQAPAQGQQVQAGLNTRLNVVADTRTNSLIVQATPRDMTHVASFIQKVDQSAGDAVSQMKLFKLQSASAPELAAFLYAAIESVTNPRASTVATSQVGGFGAAAAVTTTQATPKSVVLEILAENGQELVRSGLLTDIRFNADPRTNTLAVTAPEQSMPLITELVEILDRPSSAVATVKVFPLKNTDATVAVTLLQELFPPVTTTTGPTGQQGTLGVNLMGTSDISNLVPLQFSADPRANAVVATGGEKALLVVEAILLKLDATSSRNRTFRVIKIRNSQATAVADAINLFLQSQRALLQVDPQRYSVSEMLQQEFIVTPEVTTNSLIISASPEYMDKILQLAEKLDAEPNQVLIQALIVEVTLDNTDEFGVELGFQDSTLFDRSVVTANDILTISQTTNVPGVGQTTTQQIISQASTPGFAFNNQPLGNNTVRPEQLAGQALSNFSLGRVNSDLGYGGLVLSASSENISILVRALAARRNLRVLSRPQVLALDNTQAQIQVGQEVPVVNGVQILQNIVSPSIVREPSGIILTVLPRVSADGQVFMTVAAEKSLFDLANGVPIFTDAVNGNVVTAPIKNISTAATTVKVPDGQTIVLGGMITRTDDTVQRKVPWLGDIPLLGSVFRYDRFNHVRTELLIFLTPRIIHGPEDFEFDKQVEADRMHWFQDEAEEVHGPIFGVPPEMALPVGIEGSEFCPPEFNGGMNTEVIAPPLLESQPIDGHSVPPADGIPTQPISPKPTPAQ